MSRFRKLSALALAVGVGGALVVAQALATTTTWRGAGTEDSVMKVSFKRAKTRGHPAKVKEWSVKDLHYTCTDDDPPPFRSSTTLHGTIAKVHDGKFSYSDSLLSEDGTIRYTNTIRGEFVSKHKATGTYREKRALVGDPSAYCISEKEPWSANRQ